MRDPEALLGSIGESVEALRDVVFGFGEAQTMIRDVDGAIQFWSRGAERLYGWTRDEALGASAHQLLATAFPIDVAAINRRLRRDGHWNGELVHHHRSGARIHVASTWVLQRSAPASVVEINSDITERHRAEEALRYYQALVADSNDAIIAKTVDGSITSWNHAAERMFGWAAGEIIGRPITTIIPPDRLEDEEMIMARLRQGERIAHFETVRQHRDGRKLTVSLTVSPIRDGSGAIVGASKIVRDITRQRESEMMLHRARRMTALGELTGGIAHDFNNLLSIITNNVEVMREKLGANAELDSMASDILDAASSGGALTRRLLTFARQQALALEIIDLAVFLPTTITLLRRTLGEEIEITTDLAEGLWLVRGDASQLGDAVINLALNARDAMPPGGGHIIIAAANVQRPSQHASGLLDQFVSLTVTDNGMGMSPEVLERAMEPFFTTKPHGKGAGMGLSIVHGTVAQHFGFVEITSTPGIGTSVALFLPRSLGEAKQTQPQMSRPLRMSAAGETVLVVDDNEQLRLTVTRSLTTLGYRTLEAVDGVACLALLEAGTPCDLLFTDAVMPGGLSGLQLIRIARRLRPDLRVLLTTGFIAGGDEDAAQDGFPVLHKPYRFRELADAIHAALHPLL